MVAIKIWVRPTTAYNSAGKLKSIQVDTSQRVDDILATLRLEKKGQYFYLKGREVPMNSSLASHNIQDGDILESCPCPKFSAVLSAVLRDLNAVDKLNGDERTEDKVRPWMDGARLDPWPDRWSSEDIKPRLICLATMKQVIQRNDRYAEFLPPACHTLDDLVEFMSTVWGIGNRRHNTNAHIVKKVNKDGRPTTCWELLQNKLDKLSQIATALGPNEDALEAFIKADWARHQIAATPKNGGRRNAARSTPRSSGRVRRTLHLAATPSRSIRNVECSTCPAPGEFICPEQNCPFHNVITCGGCFRGNHPILQRNHERISIKDPRVKPILRAHTKAPYTPEYGSGSFAILATLFEVSQSVDGREREFNLVESRLKKLAQRRCRSNLYDRQARGRSAFSCVETLVDKGFLRKELIPGSEESKFSLLPPGEELGRWCFDFESTLESKILTRPLERERQSVLAGSHNHIELIIDTREDRGYADRLIDRCQEIGLLTQRRDLPAGDYLFTTGTPNAPVVLPVVIERKSWSDLADSVTGNGRSRLDCVRLNLGEERPACGGTCQLCRMKRSGCTKIMFIIEGARCWNRDDDTRCNHNSRCQHCREITERHGANVTHEALESVLLELQVKHGCIVHFTRGYNETIDSLFHIRDILSIGSTDNFPFENFCSNVRRRANSVLFDFTRGRAMELKAEDFIKPIKNGSICLHLTEILSRLTSHMLERRNGSKRCSDPNITQAFGTNVLEIESDDGDEEARREGVASCDSSDEEIQVLNKQSGWTSAQSSHRPRKKSRANFESPIIDLIDGSDDDVLVIEPHPSSKDNGVVVLDSPMDITANAVTASVSRKRRQRIETHPAKRNALNLPVLLVNGMYDYDKEYFEDINKVWKSICLSFQKGGTQTFKAYLSEQLVTSGILDDDRSPLIPRDTLLFWTLHTQLMMQTRFALTRSRSELDSIKRAWENNSVTGATRSVRTIPVATSNARNTPRQSSARRSLEFGQSRLTCLICDHALVEGSEFTTSCSHAFHPACLTLWATRTGTRKCPQCNRPGIGLPKSATPISNGIQQSVTPRLPPTGRRPALPGRPPKAPNSSNATGKPIERTIREARLRRFEGKSTLTSIGISQSSPENARFWVCERCTFSENEFSTPSCWMCESPRRQMSDNAPSAEAVVSASWQCARCTLENDFDSDKCSACTATNPFQVASQFRPSTAVGFDDSSNGPYTRDRTPHIPRTTTPLAAPARLDEKLSSAKKVVCGACRLQGHNRGNATAVNCPMYNTAEEIELRAKKKSEAERKAREKRDEAARYEQESRTQAQQAALQEQEVRRILEATTRQGEQLRQMSEKEAARKKKEAERAEKRAQRLAR